MLVRVMEDSPGRLRQVARDWGVDDRLRPSALVPRIEAAYRREVEAEARRAMHQRHSAQLRAPA